MRNPILILMAAAAALFFIGRSALQQRLSFRLSGVKLRGSVLQPVLDIAIAVQNPTRQRATLRSIVADLTIDGKFIANVSFFGSTVIAPVSETPVSISARPSLTGAFSSVADILTREGGQKAVALLKGSANIDGITYPIEITRTI